MTGLQWSYILVSELIPVGSAQSLIIRVIRPVFMLRATLFAMSIVAVIENSTKCVFA
jgi:hypothetical protein